MFLAFATATRSGELGRQVGAVLVDQRGDVLALGSNDVPRRGGGCYWPTSDDQRDIVRGFDANTRNKADLMRRVVEELGEEGRGISAERLGETSLKEITEFGRAGACGDNMFGQCNLPTLDGGRTYVYIGQSLPVLILHQW